MTRDDCLTTIAWGTLNCVWCPDGLCAKKPANVPQKCLSHDYAEKKLGIVDFEDCLPAGTQNGYSGCN